jgi:hypothetical protein
VLSIPCAGYAAVFDRSTINAHGAGSVAVKEAPTDWAATVAIYDEGIPIRVLGIGGEWAYIIVDEALRGFIHTVNIYDYIDIDPMFYTDPVLLPEFERQAVVNNPNPRDKLFLRPVPSTEVAPIGLYYNGVRMEVLNEMTDSAWARVRIGALIGYMQKRYLDIGRAAYDYLDLQPRVYTRSLSSTHTTVLREMPSEKATVFGAYPDGTDVVVLGVDPVWYHVRIEERVGFVYASDVMLE